MKRSRRNWLESCGRSIGAVFALPSISRDSRVEAEAQIRKESKSLKAIGDLPTPALVLDLDLFEMNLSKMSRYTRAVSINLRPHAKTHKCPEIARRQIAAGALGVCVSTIHEAEVMAAAGVRGLLLTSEMVGQNKIKRLIRLTRRQPETISVVDNALHASELSRAADEAKLTLNVMIDVDPGGRRTGVAPGEPAITLAEQVVKLPRLLLRGVHSYSGASAHVVGFETRRDHSHQAMQAPLETFRLLKEKGFTMEIMSGGSTGTYNIDPSLKGMTELQVGSYIFMDVDYRRIGGKSGDVYVDFAPALSVLSTVISKNHPDRATVDAGIKAFATDRRFGPEVKGMRGVEYQFGGDEHGILVLSEPEHAIKLGDRLEFIVPHCDPNINLYDRLYCLRSGRVEDIWLIAGRGHS